MGNGYVSQANPNEVRRLIQTSGRQVVAPEAVNRSSSLAGSAGAFHGASCFVTKQLVAINPRNEVAAKPQNTSMQYESDVDVDERYDEEVSVDGDQNQQSDNEFNSPKGHGSSKPKPLDQTFVPQKGCKYFSVTIGYPAMRRALRDRGWIEVKCYKKLHNIAGYTSSPGTKTLAATGLESTINRQFDGNIDLKFVLSAQDANY